jgi:hypothetical protein
MALANDDSLMIVLHKADFPINVACRLADLGNL